MQTADYCFHLSNENVIVMVPLFSNPKNNTVEPQYNEPVYNEVLGITNDFLYPSNSKIIIMKKNLDIRKVPM